MNTAIILDVGGSPPTSFRIFTRGINRTRSKGNFLFDEHSAESVMRHAADFAAEYPLDYGHSHLGMSLGDPADHHAAAGWFRLALRNGELWAEGVTWTPKAAQKLRDREYRYISPAFRASPVEAAFAGEPYQRIEQILNVALTNVPETKGLTPLVASITHPQHQGSIGIMSSNRISNKELAFLGVSREAYERTAAEVEAEGIFPSTTTLSAGPISVPGPNGRTIEIPSREELRFLGVNAEAYVKTAYEIMAEESAR